MKRLVHGYGINDADYLVKPIIKGKRRKCPYYERWTNMLSRAYSPIYHEKQPTYRDVTVCDEWKSFMSFRRWMIKQDWQKKELDKDILFPNNRVYSPSTCVFVSREVNALFAKGKTVKSKYKIGVSFHNNSGKFRSRINIHGKENSLGYYDTENDANQAYLIAKANHIKTFYPIVSKKIKSGLKRHVKIIKKELL